MKVKISKTIEYFDVDQQFKLMPSALMQLLQTAATTHVETAGYQMEKTIADTGWVLNKLHIKILRFPQYKEPIEIVTWSRRIKGVTGIREFEVYAAREKVATASSVWVFIDMQAKKIKRIPKEMNDIYTSEPDVALDAALDKWRSNNAFYPDHEMTLSLRSFDYDPMGHVNNAIYIQFVETLIMRMNMTGQRIEEYKIQYHKEIGLTIENIRVGLKAADVFYRFKIFDAVDTYASGILKLADL